MDTTPGTKYRRRPTLRHMLRLIGCMAAWVPAKCPGQPAMEASAIAIVIHDNAGLDRIDNRYVLTGDSVFVEGDSDYGRMRIDYSRRALTAEEKRALGEFLGEFPFDSLEDAYTAEPHEAGATMRTVEISGAFPGRKFYSRMSGCYAALVARFCDFVNRYFPREVAVRIDRKDFVAGCP